VHRVVEYGELQIIMPWALNGNMTDQDLGNIFAAQCRERLSL